MAEIISFESLRTNTVIDPKAIEAAWVKRQLEPGMIQPASGACEVQLANEHTAEPIKSLKEIRSISEYLVKNERYRDNMLFILGINFGLRVSDLLQLRFFMLIDENFAFRSSFPILEKKTSKTRKTPKNRYVTINDAVVDAVTLYLQHNECKMDDYLFRSVSRNGSNKNRPMDRSSVDRLLKSIAKELNLTEKVSTHTLRKTFGYHQMVMSGNDPRKLLLLQKIFGHSSAAQTLDYIGITQEEIAEAYAQMNLGGKNDYGTFSEIGESAPDAM